MKGQINGVDLPRVRSMSMSQVFANGDWLDGSGSGSSTKWRKYSKLSTIINPVKTHVFAEEHPDSINDGWIITNVTNPNAWADLPASYHGNACGFGFADGHSEIHKWKDSRTMPAIGKLFNLNVPSPNNPDVFWIMERSTRKP